eukprot:scaffold100778_cov30-Cyclotella_meneghiniana.AAC.1
MEDDNDLLLSLLEQDHQHNNNSTTDDAILSQLLASGAGAASNKHTSTNSRHRRCCCSGCKLPKDKEVPALFAFAFAILNWVGLILILFANYTSCNLIHVAWNTGSIHLSITGLGISRYQQKQKDTTAVAQCYDQISYVQHAEISQSDHFFPYTELLEQMGLVAVTLAGVAFVGFLAYVFVVAIVHPEKYSNTSVNNSRYPWRATSACQVLGGILLIGAGTAELLVLLDLMNIIDLTRSDGDGNNDHHRDDDNDNHQTKSSPICNAEYSTCHLGLGGGMAVSGIACCYAGAVLAFYATFVMIRIRRRERKEDERRIQQTYLGDGLT